MRRDLHRVKTFGLDMSVNAKKSVGAAALLILLGMAALYGGPKTLLIVVPLAIAVWYGRLPVLRGGRN